MTHLYVALTAVAKDGLADHPAPVQDDHVLVRFRLEVADGWPPVPIEDIWCRRDESGALSLANIPLFARDVAFGDRLEARGDELLAFGAVIERGGHSTVRVIAADPSEAEGIAAQIHDFDCSVAMCFIPAMLAVDVPPGADYGPLRRWLQAREQEGVLDFEEGWLAPEHGAADAEALSREPGPDPAAP